MKLRDFLEKYKPNMTKFAASCDTDVQSIYAYKLEKWKPKQSIAERIEKQTDGLVTVMELRGKDDRRKKREIISFKSWVFIRQLQDCKTRLTS